MDVIRAIEDFLYYHRITGQDWNKWQDWRVSAAREWHIDMKRIEERSRVMVCAKYNTIISIMCNSCLTPGEIAKKSRGINQCGIPHPQRVHGKDGDHGEGVRCAGGKV